MQPSNHEHFLGKNQTPTRPISSIENNNNIIDAQLQEEPVFSSQKTRMDYVTLEGIENRTGIEKKNAYTFVIKELLDNAIDFLETEHIGISQKKDQKAMETIAAAEVQVYVSREEDNKFLQITVVNSNQYGKAVFSKDMLQSIFNFETFYSSKRNQYKITRGALGDAFKEILCIPYALAREQWQGQQSSIEWNEPLIITTMVNRIQQTFLVYLVIDRINQTISSEIKVVVESKSDEQEESNFTRIEIRLPLIQHLLDLDKLKKFLTGYVTFNTHIDFIFKIPSGSSSDQTNKDDDNITLRFPQVQPINTKWSPISSIYYYSLSEFQNFILGLDNNDLQIYNVIQKSFREGSNMKKEPEFEAMTVGKLKQNTQYIKELYNKLRNTMKPLSTPSSLSLPFDSTKKARIKAITKRLEQRPSFRVSDIKYKSQYGYYKFKDGTEHPFFFEIAVVHSNNIVYYLDYVNSLNSSVMPGAYSFLTGSDSKTFQWQTQSDKKNNIISVSESIFDIFEHYGYSFNKEKCKKPRSLIIANLISPRIDYKSYGKSIINLAPFANVIAEITLKACSGGGSGTTRFSDRGNEETNSIIGFLRCLLKNRHDEVKQDPSLKDRQKWTQSTVFYHLRPILLDNGFGAETIDRQYITSEIKNVCENYLGVKREEIGITAADRAQLYFRGKWHDVGLDEIDNLVQYGTDMVIVEKEGVVKQLSPFADEKGIALLNTRGFLTEYASILSEQSRENGCNIAILTDFDASGLLIARSVPNVYRIGIDFDTLDYFGLDPGIVEEDYKPKQNHLKPLQGLAKTGGGSRHHHYDKDLFNLLPRHIVDILFPDNPFDLLINQKNNNSQSKKEIEYVSKKRIEIDSVMAAVNDNAKFWQFILSKLEAKFPTRNYNRAINIPDYVMPTSLESLNRMIQKKSIAILQKERIKLKEQFSKTAGFLDVRQYDDLIQRQLRTIIENDYTIKAFLEKIDSLIKGEGDEVSSS